MSKNTVEYIKKLTSIPSPSGYTNDIINYLDKELKSFGYSPEITNKGGLLLKVVGENDDKERFVTAHIDTLGAMVRGIKPDGRLSFMLVGGFSYNSIEGENCIVHLSNGEKLTGTILIHQTSIHVYRDAGTAERTQSNMEIRLDIKSKSAEETEKYGVQVGDFISFDTRTEITDTGFIKSRHLDDKISAAILIELLRDIKENNKKLPYTTNFYFSNNEEIGYGGNSSISPKVVEYLAVDMGAMGDGQLTDEYTVSICVKDASGPYHYDLRNHFVKLCKDNNINYKLDIYPYYGSDASTALIAGADIKHGLIGAGVESSHAYERTHTDSVEETYKLVEAYLFSEMI
ncbi:M42 family metallopeptidase [Gemelliphila palaticanis]|uniref:M42 family metallopeptidase n=1 Tax=Gemelliphila palaticanis TaxID=81950 RepID=A0ABX2T2A8_9BACL|nr:M42 family metallopeptidase [Gemella palaticanis]MBF0715664.1 M42 family metallopeptidase [Gemella palaticanis]NYS47594.1 M42 family metallopeptidase [Gemella palaticanis]